MRTFEPLEARLDALVGVLQVLVERDVGGVRVGLDVAVLVRLRIGERRQQPVLQRERVVGQKVQVLVLHTHTKAVPGG